MCSMVAPHSISIETTAFKGEARKNNINLSRLNNSVKAGNEQSLLGVAFISMRKVPRFRSLVWQVRERRGSGVTSNFPDD